MISGQQAIVIILSAANVALTSIAIGANWWTQKIQIVLAPPPFLHYPLSTNGSFNMYSDDVIQGTTAQAKFHLNYVTYFDQLTNVSSTTVYYDALDIQTGGFTTIQILNVILIVFSGLMFLYSVLLRTVPKKFSLVHHGFTLFAITSCLLCLATLITLAYVPNDLSDSFPKMVTADPTFPDFPVYNCGGKTITWNGLTFEGQTLHCGRVWNSIQCGLVSATFATVISFQDTAGSGWWWIFGALWSYTCLGLALFWFDFAESKRPVANNSVHDSTTDSQAEVSLRQKQISTIKATVG
jgi:hypothetical protein